MKILCSSIPEEGLDIAFEGKDSAWEGLAGLGFETAPHGHLHVERHGDEVLVEGDCEVVLKMPCSRCLDDFRMPVQVSLRRVLQPASKVFSEEPEVELRPEDLEVGCYDAEEDTVYLDLLVEEHILLALPMKPLCSETCKGLCPYCGTNWNHTGCRCLERVRSSPFDCLKGFELK